MCTRGRALVGRAAAASLVACTTPRSAPTAWHLAATLNSTCPPAPPGSDISTSVPTRRRHRHRPVRAARARACVSATGAAQRATPARASGRAQTRAPAAGDRTRRGAHGSACAGAHGDDAWRRQRRWATAPAPPPSLRMAGRSRALSSLTARHHGAAAAPLPRPRRRRASARTPCSCRCGREEALRRA